MIIRQKDANKLTLLPSAPCGHHAPAPLLAIAAMAFTLFSALLISAPLAQAKDDKFQSIDTIKAAAQTFLSTHSDIEGRANTTVSIGNIDNRLTLPACGTGLDTFLPSGAKVQGKTTVGVRCQGPKPWTLYVPANVTTVTQVLVTNGPLRRGHIVTAGDISLQSKNTSQLNTAYLSNPDQVVGKALKKNLGNKALFTSAVLTEPHIIQKGQHVDLQAGQGGLQVRASAIALAGGAVGDRIRVQNLSSSKIVEGTILASGVIQAN